MNGKEEANDNNNPSANDLNNNNNTSSANGENNNNEKKPQKTYVFKYELEKKAVTGYQAACKTVEEIRNLKISDLVEDEVRSRWIKFSNDRIKNLNQTDEAKWVLRFPIGDPSINNAWQILVDLVVKNVLWDIKSPAKTSGRDTQVICVYIADPNNIKEVIQVYDILSKNYVLGIHMGHACNGGRIEYITDANTRKVKPGEDTIPTFTNNELSDLYALFLKKDKFDPIEYEIKWKALENDAKIKSALLTPLNKAEKTYFTKAEAESRLKLIEKLETFQKAKKISDNEELNNMIQNLRQSLTGNYRFTTVELLNNALHLIEAFKPKLGSFIVKLFNPNQKLAEFLDTIAYLRKLVEEESLRPQSAIVLPKI